MLAKFEVGQGQWYRYKSETPLPAGAYFWYMGQRPSQETKKRLGLIAASRGREFKWLAPFEIWVKRFIDGAFDPIPALTAEPDWSLIGIRPDLLRAWQRQLVKEAWNYLAQRLDYRAGWIAPLGAGKTLGGLLVAQMYEPKNVAVLASRYLHETWRSQAEEWGVPCPVISTYESAHKLTDIKCLIIDECTALKSPDAQRTNKALELSKSCTTVLGFTGIPTAGGGPLDWRWLRVVRPGCVPAQETAWQFMWGLDTKLMDVGSQKAYITTEWDEKRITSFIHPYTRNVDIAEIAAEMPEVTMLYTMCPQPMQYKAVQAGAATTGGTHKRLAQALQITDGFVYNDDNQPIRIGSPKLSAVQDWVDGLNEPVLLVANWTESVQQLAEVFQGHWPAVVHGGVADVGAEISRFRNGQTRMMIANAGYSKGMNLQKVCRVVGFVSVSSKPDDLQQMIGRVARPGQRDGVVINFFCCEDTLDRRRIELVQKHRDMSDKFIEELLLREIEK